MYHFFFFFYIYPKSHSLSYIIYAKFRMGRNAFDIYMTTMISFVIQRKEDMQNKNKKGLQCQSQRRKMAE